MKRALTIAGSDSGGGAGIQADLKTFSAFRVYGMTVITSVTAQNTVRVHGAEYIPAHMVSLQFEAILTDIGVDGLKTGMLGNSEIIRVVAGKIRQNSISHVVVDPVMVSTGGDSLMDPGGLEVMRTELIPLSTLVTPNIPEAEALSGISIGSVVEMKEAARIIKRLGCGAVLIKGGHLEDEDALDILYDGEAFTTFSAPFIRTMNTHGTGCTYSAAILSGLILGNPLVEAVRIAKQYVTSAIAEGFPLGKGHGPLNHFVPVSPDIREKT